MASSTSDDSSLLRVRRESFIHSLVNPYYNNYLVKFRRMSKFLSIMEKQLKSLESQTNATRDIFHEHADWHHEIQQQQHDLVWLDFGGTVFKTCKSTLLTVEDSYFSTLFNGNWNVGYNSEDGTIQERFVDRDPKYFSVLLQYLRDGCPQGIVDSLYRQSAAINAEARFFGIDNIVQYTEKRYVNCLDVYTSDISVSPDGLTVEGSIEAQTTAGSGTNGNMATNCGIRCVINGTGFLQQTTFQIKLLNHPTAGINIGFKTMPFKLQRKKYNRPEDPSDKSKVTPYFSYSNQYYIGFSPASCWVSYKSLSGASAHKFADKIQQIGNIGGYRIQCCFERGEGEKSSVVWFKLASPTNFEMEHVSYWNIPHHMLVYPCVYGFEAGDKFELVPWNPGEQQ